MLHAIYRFNINIVWYDWYVPLLNGKVNFNLDGYHAEEILGQFGSHVERSLGFISDLFSHIKIWWHCIASSWETFVLVQTIVAW